MFQVLVDKKDLLIYVFNIEIATFVEIDNRTNTMKRLLYRMKKWFKWALLPIMGVFLLYPGISISSDGVSSRAGLQIIRPADLEKHQDIAFQVNPQNGKISSIIHPGQRSDVLQNNPEDFNRLSAYAADFSISGQIGDNFSIVLSDHRPSYVHNSRSDKKVPINVYNLSGSSPADNQFSESQFSFAIGASLDVENPGKIPPGMYFGEVDVVIAYE